MALPSTQWFGSGLGQNGSTSKRGASTVPVVCAAAMRSSCACAAPSATNSERNVAPTQRLRLRVMPASCGDGVVGATIPPSGANHTPREIPVLLCGLQRSLRSPVASLTLSVSSVAASPSSRHVGGRRRPACPPSSTARSSRAFTAAASAVRPCLTRLACRPDSDQPLSGNFFMSSRNAVSASLRAPERQQRRALQLAHRNRPVGRLHVGEPVLERHRLREVLRRLIGAAAAVAAISPDSTS